METGPIEVSMFSINVAVVIFVYILSAGFLGLFSVIVWKMFTDKINLEYLVSELASEKSPNPEDGGVAPSSTRKASMSRFQLLVFTMVVAGLFLILSIENGQLIEIPNGVLALLGISGGGFVISKSISK